MNSSKSSPSSSRSSSRASSPSSSRSSSRASSPSSSRRSSVSSKASQKTLAYYVIDLEKEIIKFFEEKVKAENYISRRSASTMRMSVGVIKNKTVIEYREDY